VNNKRRLDDLDAWIEPPAAPPLTFEERAAAIVVHIHRRWTMSTREAVRARKVKPGVREEFPTRDELLTWDDVPRALWGTPGHLKLHLIDPLTLYSICTSGELRILEIIAEGLAQQSAPAAPFEPPGADEPDKRRHRYRRRPRQKAVTIA
jgi:hypothetical protein